MDVSPTQRTAIICLRLECPGSREVCGLKCRRGEEDNTAITTTGGPDVVLGDASSFCADRADSKKPESHGLRRKSLIERFLPHAREPTNHFDA
ncbi:hypothetical protein ALC62_11672 [Cyphomyrmex costatus]|uniref:Uncharacterized protein n=1 Tax=Cyphomyrmex costatus TaxID=456900 RepID=A0A195CB02_9HYME|nr:hypothetical protein ALC62_11672 [Cyphomyrmex costatus]